nr:RecName: Full=Antifungal protein 2 small subunit; AltName: Full=CW-2 [Malva parviflora]
SDYSRKRDPPQKYEEE